MLLFIHFVKVPTIRGKVAIFIDIANLLKRKKDNFIISLLVSKITLSVDLIKYLSDLNCHFDV